MDKQEFLEKHTQLSNQMKELEESYINANAPYPVGTRVKVTGSNGKSRVGIVKGSTIQTVNALRDIGAGLKTLVGGELTKYNEMMDKARRIATDRMVEEANRLGADAIVCMRFATSSIMQSAAEIMAYGTAVKFR